MFMHWRKSREPAHLPFFSVCVHWFAALNDVVTVYSGMFIVFGFVMRHLFLVVFTICIPGLSISRLPDICLSFFCFVREGESLLFRIIITPSPRTPVLVILLSYAAFPLLLS